MRDRYSVNGPRPWSIRGNPQGRHPNEPGARGVYLVEVDDDGDVSIEFRSMDCVRWERAAMDISQLDGEQGLIDGIHQRIDEALKGANGVSVVLRITLVGIGSLHGSLQQPDLLEHVTEVVNDEWAKRGQFAWCERIVDETTAPFNRDDRIAGSDFMAEVLRTYGPCEGRHRPAGPSARWSFRSVSAPPLSPISL